MMFPKKFIFIVLAILFITYSAVVYTIGTGSNNSYTINEEVRNGKLVFQKKNCISCHQIYGLGGYMGPDLTNVITEPTKGDDYARAFLMAGTEKMPDFELSAQEIDQLIAFLEFLGKDGIYPPKDPIITWYGTVEEGPEDE